MNKSALITGASKRIGKQIAIALGKKGYHIHLHYHLSHHAAEETITFLRQEGISCDLIQADLQNPPDIEHMISGLMSTDDALSVIINNASVFYSGSLQESDVEIWDVTMAVNLRAPWLIVKYAFDALKKNNGCVINILDSGIEKVWTKYPAYQISKVGLAHLTKLMAKTYAPDIRINGISPGLILPSEDGTPDDWRILVDRLPMKRSGNPQDVVDGIMFLINQEYITGEILFIDGGYQYV
jgi:NAD(P)-dependent dehydrogenase (short-subunit alcohol dehydrogenase family)